MVVSNQVELIEALANGKPESVLGTAEGAWIDFKRGRYDLSTPRARWELAKDVVALANSRGGIIACGFKATKVDFNTAESVTELWPFDRQRVNVEQMKQALQDLVHPPVKIAANWFPHPPEVPHRGESTSEDLHYLLIVVEPIPEPDRYAILRRMVDERDKLVSGPAIPVRHDDLVRWMTADEIYRLVNDGYRVRYTSPTVPLSPMSSSINGDALIDALERANDWDDAPVLYLQSLPVSGPDFLDGWPAQVREILTRRDVLRPMGFHFFNPYEQVTQHDDRLEIADGRMAISVSAGGYVTAGALATSDFLGWAMSSHGVDGQINVVALTDVLLDYFSLVDREIVPRVTGTWTHRVVCRRFQSAEPAVTLSEGHVSKFPGLSGQRPASSDEWATSWTSAGDAETDTFSAVRRIYALFGHDADSNPFVLDGRLSTEAFIEYARR